MFTHLLVPLDGSHLAEAALPAAVYLAGLLGARLTLFHVVEADAAQEVHGERHLTDAAEAQTYLAEVAARAIPAGVPAEEHVHTPAGTDVARSIIDHASDLAVDLVVMCAHGRGGLRDLLYGNIAQQVIALGTTPILLVQPDAKAAPRPFACRRILVPLDGVSEHEGGLSIAEGLAARAGAALHLLLVVHTAATLPGARAVIARMLPGTTAGLLDLAITQGEEYLNRQATRLRGQGIEVTTKVEQGDPADRIVHAARRGKADLIVLSTHGKTGLDAFWADSVAPNVSAHTRIPLLLVRAGDTT